MESLSYSTIRQLRDNITVETKLGKDGESPPYITSIKSLDGKREVVEGLDKKPDKTRFLLKHIKEVI